MRKVKTENRSTRRTRESLQKALLHCMSEKPLSDITVKELISEANVCRSTFYDHYFDIYDLEESIGSSIIDEVEVLMHQLEDTPIKKNGEYPTIEAVVKVYAKHAETIRLLNGPNGSGHFDARLQEKIYLLTRMLRAQKEAMLFNDRRHRYYSYYVISGGISVLNRLLEEGTPWESDKIAHILGSMALAGEKVFLEDDL